MSKQNTIQLERPKRFGEMLGLCVGGMIAPLAALGSMLRRARGLHPRGIHFRAEIDVLAAPDSPFHALAQGLAQGLALVRLSTGLSRSQRGVLPDVLGFAIRFNADPNMPTRLTDDAQDLLMVTSRSAMMLLLAALLTNRRDFLDNVYHGMGKFELPGHPDILLRLVPQNEAESSKLDRYAKLRAAVAAGNAVLRLEALELRESMQWMPVVRIDLTRELDIDDRTTAFWPFADGQDLRPQGFLQFMRPIPYLASQWARGI